MKNVKKDNDKNKYSVLIALTVLAMAVAYFCINNTTARMILFLLSIGLVCVMMVFILKKQKLLRKIFKVLDESSDGNESYSGSVEERLSLLVKEKHILEGEVRKKIISEFFEGKRPESEIKNAFQELTCNASVLFVVYGKNYVSEELANKVRKTAEEHFSELAEVCFSENRSAGQLCMIINFTSSTENLKEKIERVSRKFINVLKSEFDTEADVIYGRTAESPGDLPAIYREVKETAFLCQKDGCILDSDKIAQRSCEAYNYSVDTEIGIIIYIKKGDFARAYGLIRNALDEILYQKSYPIYIIRCFMFEVAGTILKAIGETEKENGIRLGCSKNLNNIFYADSVIEMEYILKEYLKEVCECIAESNKGVASPFCEKIKQYVRENYADADMNVNAIAARFYINPAYLSNMFKRNTDIKLLDYINKVRIDEAKKLMLANPEITIEELSEKSGFKNSRTFRRIFLKYEEVSPSKFVKK